MAAVSEPQVQRQHLINLGEGKVQVGDGEKNLQDVGSLEGNCVVTTVREVVGVKDGNPMVDIGDLVAGESAAFSFVLKEQFAEDILRHLGYTPSTKQTKTTASAVTARTDEQKVLWGTQWASLKERNIAVSPAPVVNTGVATLVSYTEDTDFEIDYVGGRIRRLSGSAISDGGRIYIDYSATVPANRAYGFGGDMQEPTYFYWRFFLTRANGYRYMVDIPKATFANPLVQNFNRGALNTREVVLKMLADRTQSSGSQYYTVRDEYNESLDA